MRNLACLILVLLFAVPSLAQPAGQGGMPVIDGPTRAAIVDSVTAVIDSVYVLEEPAGRIVATLRAWREERLTRNALDRLSDRELDDIGLSRSDIDRAVREGWAR